MKLLRLRKLSFLTAALLLLNVASVSKLRCQRFEHHKISRFNRWAPTIFDFSVAAVFVVFFAFCGICLWCEFTEKFDDRDGTGGGDRYDRRRRSKSPIVRCSVSVKKTIPPKNRENFWLGHPPYYSSSYEDYVKYKRMRKLIQQNSKYFNENNKIPKWTSLDI